jgi:hypothetical protein
MEGSTGMSALATSLTTTLSAENLWGVFGEAVPIIGVTVLVALGFYLVRKAIKKASKAKAGV